MKSGEMKKEDMELVKFHHSELYKPFPDLNVKVDIYTLKSQPSSCIKGSPGYNEWKHSLTGMRLRIY
jgi:hypothetical protein